MLIQRTKSNLCWKLLRHYGFDNDLNLKPVELNLAISSAMNIELSSSAWNFLTLSFKQYSNNREFLAYEDLRDIFATIDSPLWAHTRSDEGAWLSLEKIVATGPDFTLSLTSWHALWNMMTALDHNLVA
jgi:hypothetical protein